MERSSLESAFETYWPKPKPKRKSIPLSATPEPTDIAGVGVPHGWAPWQQVDPSQPGVECRVSLGEGAYIQFRNVTDQIRHVGAMLGTSRFALTLNPGQTRDLHSAESGTWSWLVR